MNIIWNSEIYKYTNPQIVQQKAIKYFNKNVQVFPSNKPKKKYMILNPNTNKYIYFGQMGYEDFTKHKDLRRRQNYLKRSANIKGNWKDNPYSPNNLSRYLLW
jgi:hypothetical protein